MNNYNHLRNKAIEFRNQGLTLSEICQHLSLGKSTVYYWIKHIPIKRTIKQSLAQKIGTEACSKKYQLLRDNAYNEAYNKSKILFKNSLFRDFIVLYLTEGYRKNRNQVSICNSNEIIIFLSNKILKTLTNSKIKYLLQCHIDNSVKKLKQFWGKLLNINPSLITVIRKSNSGNMTHRKWRSINGVLSLVINDTLLRSKLQAWMDYLQKIWIKNSPIK